MLPTAMATGPDNDRPVKTRIAVRGLTKSYTRSSGEQVVAVDDVDLDVAEGEFLVLLGPSGCGKTTLLRVLAGLEPVQAGRVELDGVPVDDAATRLRVPTERRRLSMMFQSYALWPHKTVFQNVEYPLTTRRLPRAERNERVHRMLAAVGIGALAGQHPAQLSGGQQQRVALARSLVAGDGIVLFDEPLSNVDAKVRELLRAEIQRLHRDFGFTAVYVTHDQEEALTLATRVLVLREGRIAQSGPPREIYEQPVDSYVVRFMGATNELPGRLTRDGNDRAVAMTRLGSLHGRAPAGMPDGAEVTAFSRPEKWALGPAVPPGVSNSWPGTVTDALFLGSSTDYSVLLDDTTTVRVRMLGSTGPAVGAQLHASIDAADVLFLDATTDGPDSAGAQ